MFSHTHIFISCCTTLLQLVHVQVGRKRLQIKLVAIILSNLNRFSKLFHWKTLWQRCNQVAIKIQPHLAYAEKYLVPYIGMFKKCAGRTGMLVADGAKLA